MYSRLKTDEKVTLRNLIIGGLEEAGWMYVLQPRLDKKWLFFSICFSLSLSFFRGAVYKIAGKGCVSAYVLFHTMFNSASSLVGSSTMTWAGTVVANAAMILFSIVIVAVLNRRRYKE